MTTATSTTLKNAGVNILAILAAYLLQKVSDQTTTFAPTKTAATTVALQAVQEIVTAKISSATTVVADTTIAQ